LVGVAGWVLVMGNDCLIPTTGIASGIDGKHYDKDCDAINDWMRDHCFDWCVSENSIALKQFRECFLRNLIMLLSTRHSLDEVCFKQMAECPCNHCGPPWCTAFQLDKITNQKIIKAA
jgi:hypothetical protein